VDAKLLEAKKKEEEAEAAQFELAKTDADAKIKEITDAKKKVFDECKTNLDNIKKLVTDNFPGLASRKSTRKILDLIKMEKGLLEGLKLLERHSKKNLNESRLKKKKADEPAATPAETPAATPAETPAETPAATPAETPAATPAETPAATPAETPAETPAADPATPSEEPVVEEPEKTPEEIIKDAFMTGAKDLIEKTKPKIDAFIKKSKETFGKIKDELKMVKRSTPSDSHNLDLILQNQNMAKRRFKQKYRKLNSKLKEDETLNVAESKAALDDLVALAYSVDHEVIGDDGMELMAELQNLGGELNSLLTFEVLAGEIKSMIDQALEEDQPMGKIKRADIMSYMINKVTDENSKYERAVAKCYDLKNDIN